MKYKILLTSTAIYAVGLSALAAVPCEWVATPQRPAPATFDRFHGESLDFRCTFTGFGALPFDGASDVRLWYQTNGMGAAWWSLPATVSSNMLAATFPPSADPGAERLSVFFGAPSNAYAAAQVRFRNSPGPFPNTLDPPSILDWQSSLAAATNTVYGAMMAEVVSATNALLTSLDPTISNAYAIATNALTRQEAVLGFTAWSYTGISSGYQVVREPHYFEDLWIMTVVRVSDGAYIHGEIYNPDPDATELNFILQDGIEEGLDVAATRVRLPTWSDIIYITNDIKIITTEMNGKAKTNDVQLTPVYGGNGERFGEWRFEGIPPGATNIDLTQSGPRFWEFTFDLGSVTYYDANLEEGEDATNFVFFCSDIYGEGSTEYTVIATRTENPIIGYTLGSQTNNVLASTNILISADIAQTVSNTVTKAYVEDLGIESGIQFEEDPRWEAAKGGYATTGTVAQVSEAVGTLWSYVYGDSVWIAVTNHMRTVGCVSPSFQLWEVREGVTNLVYWSKEEITNVTHDLIYDCKTNLEQTVRNAVAEMPDKAWSKYQSATGNEAPDGVTIVSTPTIQLTGGGEWYRYVDVSSNSVWFLKSNGLHTFGGDTNGYFRILDDEGNATFEVRKTDSYLVDAVASSVHFDENGNFCVSFESNIEPVIYTTASLSAPNFLPEGEDPNVTVTWTQSGGVYTATLEQAVKGPSLFAYAKVEVQGETVIRNTVPTDLQGGIIVNGVKYNVGTATINGNTVLTLTPRN